MSDSRNIYELLPRLALGDVTPEERKIAADHLAACPVCRNEYAKISRLLEDLQDSLRSVPVPGTVDADSICRTFFPCRDAAVRHDWMETPPALWRDVMVALDSVDAPKQLSSCRMENIVQRVQTYQRQKKFQAFRRKIAVAAAVAASVFFLLGLFLTETGVFRTQEGRDSVLRAVQVEKARGLDIPESVPGILRLAGGEATVQLDSGVRLTLLGPAELKVKSGMFIRLYYGSLLADVPHEAAGFTVRTPELEVYDLGTVFCVSALGGTSDVFVFKGGVQVNESGQWGTGTLLSEAGMSICKAGEGVYKKGGKTPVRFTADRGARQQMFESIKGSQAQENPVCAIKTARRIADAWINRYVPELNLGPHKSVESNRIQTGSSSGASHIATTDKSKSFASSAKTKHFRCCSRKSNALNFVGPQIPNMYYAIENKGCLSWNKTENWCFYQSCGGGFVGRLPNSNDIVRINAATLAVEDGCALNIGSDVNAECYCFASGYMNYPGTAHLRLDGGTLTSATSTIIGMYYPGLATLESGILYTEKDFLIGGYGNPDGWGVVTNNGADISALRVHMGHEAGTFGRLVHNNGYLDCRASDIHSSLQVGLNGGAGEFEADAGFKVNSMGIGRRTSSAGPYGTGIVRLAEGAVGEVHDALNIANGTMFMDGGIIRLENTTGTLTNLYLNEGAENHCSIEGWGAFSCSDLKTTLRMINNGTIIADGKGVERDLDFNLIAVINSENASGGWYAVNRGRVLFPRTYQSFSPGTYYCLGDLYSKETPALVNSLAFSFSSPVCCMVRGGLCAPDRRDIPEGLPENMQRIGVWCLGAYSDKALLKKETFSGISLVFRYDDAKFSPKSSKVQLYHYNGDSWDRVGECDPDASNLIPTETALPPVNSDDYNIGWFAVMAVEMNGTVMLLQ
ncbi:MAG: FecR domain-containing protein [Kiritimatiellia bacterium]